MSEQLRESLSAALDDAADEFELRRVLDEATRDDALRDTFARYQLIKSTLRNEVTPSTLKYRTQLQRRVRAALDVDTGFQGEETEVAAEDAPVAAREPAWRHRATAAFVAFLTVLGVFFGVETFEQDVPASGLAQIAAPRTTPVVDSTASADDGATGAKASAGPEDRRRQARYLRAYLEGVARGDAGIVGLTRTVSLRDVVDPATQAPDNE